MYYICLHNSECISTYIYHISNPCHVAVGERANVLENIKLESAIVGLKILMVTS